MTLLVSVCAVFALVTVTRARPDAVGGILDEAKEHLTWMQELRW